MLACKEKPWTLAQRVPVSVGVSPACVSTQGVIACGRRRVEARLQVSQPTQRADDAPTDFLDHSGDVGIAGRLACDKARLEALVGTIQIDPFKKDTMKMDIEEKRSTTPCRPA